MLNLILACCVGDATVALELAKAKVMQPVVELLHAPKPSSPKCPCGANCDCFLITGQACECEGDSIPVKKRVAPEYLQESHDDYKFRAAQALREDRVLVVAIGCEPVVPAGYLGVRDDRMDGGPGLWVSVPYKGELRAVKLEPGASRAEIREAAKTNLDNLKRIDDAKARQGVSFGWPAGDHLILRSVGRSVRSC